jgi:hypothetical protein
MSVSIFSYCGRVTVGLMVDPQLIPDPTRVITQLEREISTLARMSPRPQYAVAPAPSRQA